MLYVSICHSVENAIPGRIHAMLQRFAPSCSIRHVLFQSDAAPGSGVCACLCPVGTTRQVAPVDRSLAQVNIWKSGYLRTALSQSPCIAAKARPLWACPPRHPAKFYALRRGLYTQPLAVPRSVPPVARQYHACTQPASIPPVARQYPASIPPVPSQPKSILRPKSNSAM